MHNISTLAIRAFEAYTPTLWHIFNATVQTLVSITECNLHLYTLYTKKHIADWILKTHHNDF